MAAEAHWGNDNDAQAQEYLNQVRNREGTALPDVSSTGDALFNDIVRERMLELCFEGHRFVDLVRWDLADDELADEGFIAGKHERLPIPNADVLSGGLEQNDLY
jgi:hypothetical protein